MSHRRFLSRRARRARRRAGAVLAAAVVILVLVVAVHMPGGLVGFLVMILAVLAVLAAAGIAWLVVLLRAGRSEGATRPRAALTAPVRQSPASVRIKAIGPLGSPADLAVDARPGCICPLPYWPGGPVPCVAAGRCMRPSAPAPAADDEAVR